MDDLTPANRRSRILWITLFAALASILLGLLRYRLSQSKGRQAPQPSTEPDLDRFQGLTEDEAIARRPPSRSEENKQEARKVRRDIWRSSTFSIFNLSMLGLAVAQTLLGDPLSALLTVGILILNIAMNAGQQLYATGKVEKLLDRAEPLPTAIRDGRIRSISAAEIVVGDVLVVGPGDQFLTDGELLSGRPRVFETAVAEEESRFQYKQAGEAIRAGSYNAQGRAIYRVTGLPAEIGGQGWTPVQDKSELTPLQRIMARVLRLMLGFITLFLVLLVLDMFNWPLFSRLFEADYRETVSIFFSIAPNSLFFMIVATYAIGSARLGDLGAVVRDSRAVESLAQISVLCFSKTGALTGAQVKLEMIPSTNGLPALAESQVRQILGDFAHSIESDNLFFQVIGDNFDGSRRPVKQAAGFLSAYGWQAVTFVESDLQGTFAIGEPQAMEPYLDGEARPAEIIEDGPAGESAARRFLGGLTRLFRRDEGETSGETAVDPDQSEEPASSSETSQPVNSDGPDSNFLLALRSRLANLARPAQDAAPEEGDAHQPEPPRPRLLFAYSPEPQPLLDRGGAYRLPDKLVPLCHLSFEEQLRPEAREAIRAFTDSGVKIKILSTDDLDRVSDAARQLGLLEGIETAPPVSGYQLAQMDESGFDQLVSEATIFGHLTVRQKSEIVRALRRRGERVAMVGDGVEDVPAMTGANLSITLQSSSQAALSTADIVLLDDSLEVLPTVLERGQRLVNGMLDILKINLVQISYILILILTLFASGRLIFYYHPTQGGVVAFFTIIIPSLGLTFWASAGPLPRQYMRSRMVHFLVPGAITMALAALTVSLIFGRGIFDIAYSQLAVTHVLIATGLLLIVFVQPPTRFWVGGDVLSGDWRNTYMAIVLFVLFIAATYIPLTQELLRLAPLQDIQSYLIVGAVAIVWLFVVRAIWRAPWLNRYVGILSDRLERRRFGVLTKDA